MDFDFDLLPYRPEDCPGLARLFYDTVHRVCAADYAPRELDAWATGAVDLAVWNASFLAHRTLVAWHGGDIIGFGDMDAVGCFDRLYVHADFQHRGIASALANELEAGCAAPLLSVYASRTAKGFFLRRGYRLIRPNVVVRQDVELENFYLEKRRPQPL